jgi:hypothetical protein
MNFAAEENYVTNVSARVAGEDLQPGDYISILAEIIELPSFLWCCPDSPLSPDEPVRIRLIPDEAGQPLKVFAVCLPFVYAKQPAGETATLDTRRQQLVRLDRLTGRTLWKRQKNGSKRKRK